MYFFQVLESLLKEAFKKLYQNNFCGKHFGAAELFLPKISLASSWEVYNLEGREVFF
jgi:hypothetical protein